MDLQILLPLLAYVVLVRITLDWIRGSLRDFLFGSINVIAFLGLVQPGGWRGSVSGLYYLGFVLVMFVLARRRSLLALWTPIAVLVGMKFFVSWLGLKAWEWAGVSYMMFRLTLVSYEARAGAVAMPGVWQFLAYAFYLPTAWVGPINPFREFRGFDKRRSLSVRDVVDGLSRVVYGYFQFRVVSPIINRLSFGGHWMDANEYGLSFFLISCVASFLYLYFNFCGFCDIALGISKLLGVPVVENFDRPFLAVNVKDFWNRWHISLSTFMRDLVFNPLSKALTRRLGPASAQHAVAISIFVVFTLIGIWHGAGVNYLLFGVMHAIGVIWNHYQAIWLKKRLGKKYKSYATDRRVQFASRVLTLAYVSLSFFFFENNLPMMGKILSRLTGF